MRKAFYGLLVLMAVAAGFFAAKYPRSAPLALATPATSESVASEAKATPDSSPRGAARVTLDKGLDLLLRGGDRAEVRKLLEHAAAQDQTFAAPHYNLAALDESDQQWDAAIGQLEKVLGLAPGGKLAGRATVDLARVKATRQLWKTPEGQAQVRYESSVAQARLLLQLDRPEEAITEATGALGMDGKRPEARLALADALARTGRYDAALVHLRLAAEAAPALKGRIDKAIGEVSQLKEYESLVMGADQALSDARYADAADGYQKAWTLRPLREACGLRAATALAFDGKFDRAQAMLEKLLASKSPEVSREAGKQLATVRTLREQDQIMARSRADAEQMRKKTAALAKQMGIDLGSDAASEPSKAAPSTPGGSNDGHATTRPAARDPVLEAIEKIGQ